MRLGERVAIGFDSAAWIGASVFFHTQTIWVDFFGLYLSVYMGRRADEATDPSYCENCKGPCRDETGEQT